MIFFWNYFEPAWKDRSRFDHHGIGVSLGSRQHRHSIAAYFLYMLHDDTPEVRFNIISSLDKVGGQVCFQIFESLVCIFFTVTRVFNFMRISLANQLQLTSNF
jgi:hypothetical protein